MNLNNGNWMLSACTKVAHKRICPLVYLDRCDSLSDSVIMWPLPSHDSRSFDPKGPHVPVPLKLDFSSCRCQFYAHLPFTPTGAQVVLVAGWSASHGLVQISGHTIFPEKYNKWGYSDENMLENYNAVRLFSNWIMSGLSFIFIFSAFMEWASTWPGTPWHLISWRLEIQTTKQIQRLVMLEGIT